MKLISSTIRWNRYQRELFLYNIIINKCKIKKSYSELLTSIEMEMNKIGRKAIDELNIILQQNTVAKKFSWNHASLGKCKE
jgi:hypothetical protein